MTNEEIADDLPVLIEARLGIAPADLECPREKSFMTPCIARDGSLAMADNGQCVGCGASAIELWHAEAKRRA